MTFERARKQSLVAQTLSRLIALPSAVRNLAVRTVPGVRSEAPVNGTPYALETTVASGSERESAWPQDVASVLVLDNVVKRYGALIAVNAVSFEVRPGEIFGILGPNGAGKTTTLEMIEGLRTPDSGSITICGEDAVRARRRVQQRIGVQLQSQTLWPELTVQETLQVFRSLFKKRVPLETLLDRFSLQEKRRALVSGLSGGQKQRLALACAVVNDPEVVFLDEPTTGLDPQARHVFWDVISDMKSEGKTIILTTHYMEEAAVLCERVAVMDRGRIIALGTPRDLVQQLECDNTIECHFDGGVGYEELIGLPGVVDAREQKDGSHFIFTRDIGRSMASLLALAQERGATMANLQVRSATLEDVFISLTGRRLRD